MVFSNIGSRRSQIWVEIVSYRDLQNLVIKYTAEEERAYSQTQYSGITVISRQSSLSFSTCPKATMHVTLAVLLTLASPRPHLSLPAFVVLSLPPYLYSAVSLRLYSSLVIQPSRVLTLNEKD
jgi:hypothetical protein